MDHVYAIERKCNNLDVLHIKTCEYINLKMSFDTSFIVSIVIWKLVQCGKIIKAKEENKHKKRYFPRYPLEEMMTY